MRLILEAATGLPFIPLHCKSDPHLPIAFTPSTDPGSLLPSVSTAAFHPILVTAATAAAPRYLSSRQGGYHQGTSRPLSHSSRL